MARMLAHVEVIESLDPIHGKDRIVLAHMKNLGWSVIVNAADYAVGDMCVYCEIDSVMPADNKEFAFLEKKKYRIKTMKMGGVLSQGICFPLSILPNKNWKAGDDVTKVLGIMQYESEMDNDKGTSQKVPVKLSWIPWVRWKQKRLASRKAGFPRELPKTDETRIESLPWLLDNQEASYVVTEKLDGCSATFLLRRGKTRWLKRETFEYMVCSRNLRLFHKDNSVYWKVSDKYMIEAALHNMIGDRAWVAIQGECLAPNVQKNRYKIADGDVAFKGHKVSIPGHVYDPVTAASILESRGIDYVPILDIDFHLPATIAEMQAYANGKSVLADTLREGVVIRSTNGRVSFKSVDPIYLLKD